MAPMELFYSSVRELVESESIERLEKFKKQIETDLVRIGYDESLNEKYEFLSKAIILLYQKKTA
jgi:hypothetical protein